jgi:hypothetical protein
MIEPRLHRSELVLSFLNVTHSKPFAFFDFQHLPRASASGE